VPANKRIAAKNNFFMLKKVCVFNWYKIE